MARGNLRGAFHEGRIGEELLRRAVHIIDAGLGAAHHQGVRHVVAAVAHVNDLAAAYVAESLAERHEVGEDLRRVGLVGEAVPDGDAGVFGEIDHGLLLEAAEEDAVVEAAEDAGGVLDALLVAEVRFMAAEILGVAALVLRGDDAGVAGTGGALLEDEDDVAAVEEVTADAGGLAGLERDGDVDKLGHLLVGEAVEGEKRAAAEGRVEGKGLHKGEVFGD